MLGLLQQHHLQEWATDVLHINPHSSTAETNHDHQNPFWSSGNHQVQRACQSIWWPGLSNQIKRAVENCVTCAELKYQPHKLFMTAELPTRPCHNYVAVDYFSRYIEIAMLTSVIYRAVIASLKAIFARYGVLVILRMDPGSLYTLKDFAKFTNNWGFQHVTNSPCHFINQWSNRSLCKNNENPAKEDKKHISFLACLQSNTHRLQV